MALRSLGASLLAKARPGSLSRETIEKRMLKPEIPGKGAVGTAARDLTQETAIVPPAPGSEKVIRAAPGVESASLPGIAAQNVPLVAGVGMPNIPAPARPGAEGQPLFQGGVTPASQAGQVGRQAQATAMTGSPVSKVAQARQAAQQPQVQGAQTQVQAPSPKDTVGSFFPGIASFGGRVSAEGEKGGTIAKNLTQAIVATLSKPGSAGEAWATNPAVTQKGTGSISSVLKAADRFAAPLVNALYNLPNVVPGLLRSLQQTASKGVNKLRSLFGK